MHDAGGRVIAHSIDLSTGSPTNWRFSDAVWLWLRSWDVGIATRNLLLDEPTQGQTIHTALRDAGEHAGRPTRYGGGTQLTTGDD